MLIGAQLNTKAGICGPPNRSRAELLLYRIAGAVDEALPGVGRHHDLGPAAIGIVDLELTGRGSAQFNRPPVALARGRSLKVPDGDNWVEFMLYDQFPGLRQLGVFHHIGMEDADVAKSAANRRKRLL